MAEEHRFEGHRLCANNCGFFGSAATMNFCSTCYRDFCEKENQVSSSTPSVEKFLFSSLSIPELSTPERSFDALDSSVVLSARSSPLEMQLNRCFACRKRVGLTGFRCRCGSIFCGLHRYAEDHGCAFDFKKNGREAIARDNPVVKAQKLEKI